MSESDRPNYRPVALLPLLIGSTFTGFELDKALTRYLRGLRVYDQDGKPHTIKPRPNPVHHPTRLDEASRILYGEPRL
ncbi:hypothetical protein J6590_044006 [Homalodisca vitripennis]|nr:hypothetical protein J6590_044006 [Homalodisca vitripennis]